MAGPKKIKKIPYPPSPADVPDDLTDYPETYRAQQNLLLAGLFIFLLLYLGLIVLFALLGLWCFLTLSKPPQFFVFKIVGIVLCGTFVLYLVKGFFKRQPVEKELRVEITEEEQPVLFGFIDRLCDELDAPKPNRVFVSLDVNAAVMPRTSLVNLLFIEPKKDLLIGLGLVNVCNLSEFKSVMAHEFGHFSQSAHSFSYAYVASRIIIDLIEGEDWFDRMVDWCKRQDNAVKVFGLVIGGCLWGGRKVLHWMFRVITLQRMAVMREQEFHADLVAVKAAGSDAVGLSLMRLRAGNLCLMQAMNDLSVAADHKLYTRDLFYHQEKAEPVVRKKKKDPNFGVRPDSDDPTAGKDIRIFDPEQETADQEDIPEMRRTHPPAHETEENAKATFIPAVVDIRSPWLLFSEVEELKERLTYKFYRRAFGIPKDADLADPVKVQEYIDNEHAETTYDPKYQGVYDERKLEPGDLGELNELVRTSPWAEDRIDKVLDKLYDGCREKADEFAELNKERASLTESIIGQPSPKMRRMIDDVDAKLDKLWDWFKSFDRRSYLIHVQMGGAVNADWRDELVERYRFHLEVQRLYTEARNNFEKADAHLTHLFRSNADQVTHDQVVEVMQVLRQAWRALKKIVQDAKEINLPAMKNFEEGERLADFILQEKMCPEPPLSQFPRGAWLDKLMKQLNGVRVRCTRLHFKSVGGILALQERIQAAWKARRGPAAAEVLEAAEVVDAAEVVEAAEVIDAAPVEAAEVFDAEVVETAEVVVPAPVAAKPRSGPIAAPAPAPAPAPKPVPTSAAVVAPPARVPEPVAPAAPVVEPPAPAAEPTPAEAAEEPSAVPIGHPAIPPAAAESPAPPAPPTMVMPTPPPRPAPAEPPAAVAPAPPRADAQGSPSEPAPAAPPAAAPALPADPVEEIFSLDADQPAPAAAEKSEPVVGEIFSLDLDEAPPAKPAPAPKPAPAAAKAGVAPPAEDVFSLDADDRSGPAMTTPAAAAPQPAGPELTTAARAPSPSAKPAAKPARPATPPAGEASEGTLKAARNGRPAIRITFVRPGEKSPLEK